MTMMMCKMFIIVLRASLLSKYNKNTPPILAVFSENLAKTGQINKYRVLGFKTTKLDKNYNNRPKSLF